MIPDRREQELVELYDRFVRVSSQHLADLAAGGRPSPTVARTLREIRGFLNEQGFTIDTVRYGPDAAPAVPSIRGPAKAAAQELKPSRGFVLPERLPYE